jgi:hypothetical protein
LKAIKPSPAKWRRRAGALFEEKSPSPETTAEAANKGELEAPLRAMITQDGDWERVSEVDFAEAKEPEEDESLEADRDFLARF